MLKTIFSLVCLLAAGCKIQKASVKNIQVEKIESILYFKNDLFVKVEDDTAFSESFTRVGDHVGLRREFLDTLLRQNDSLYAGKKYTVYLRSKILYFDVPFDPKDMFPIRLQVADSRSKAKWEEWHNQLLLQKKSSE